MKVSDNKPSVRIEKQEPKKADSTVLLVSALDDSGGKFVSAS